MSNSFEDLEVGFIGYGKHSKANMYPSVQLAGAGIQSVATRTMEHSKEAAKKYNASNAYDDYQEMIDREDLDAVFVITAGEKHARLVSDCLEAGHNVFVEKPLGSDEVEAREVADLAEEVDKTVAVGFMKRFAPPYEEMDRIMNQTESFGDVISFRGMFAITSGREGWEDEKYLKFGAIHYVDLMRHLFGEPQDVSGFKNSHKEEVNQNFSVKFENGVVGNMFFAGLPAWKRHHEELTVTGRDGFVKVNNMKTVKYHFDRESSASVPRWQVMDEEDRLITPKQTSSSGGWQDLYRRGYVGEVEHFFECLVEDKEPVFSARDNVRTMAFCDQIVDSLE